MSKRSSTAPEIPFLFTLPPVALGPDKSPVVPGLTSPVILGLDYHIAPGLDNSPVALRPDPRTQSSRTPELKQEKRGFGSWEPMITSLHPSLQPVFCLAALPNGALNITSGTVYRLVRQKTVPQSEAQADNHRFPCVSGFSGQAQGRQARSSPRTTGEVKLKATGEAKPVADKGDQTRDGREMSGSRRKKRNQIRGLREAA